MKHFQQEFSLSERWACALAGQPRSVQCYEGSREPDDALRERLRALAVERPRFGNRRLAILLRREGVDANHKRVWRVYRETGARQRGRTSAGRWTS